MKRSKKPKQDKYPLKLLYSDELKAIISTNLIHEKASITNRILYRGNIITKVTKFFTRQYTSTSVEINEDEESQRRYRIAREGWKKVRKHYWAFLFLKKENVFMGFNSNEDKKPISYQSLVVLPTSLLVGRINYCKAISILYIYIMVPYRFFFEKISTDDAISFVYIDLVMDIFFLFEIFINFFKAAYSKGTIVNEFKIIAWKYVSSSFAIDVVAIIPYYWVGDQFYIVKFVRYLQISFVLNNIDLAVSAVNCKQIIKIVILLIFVQILSKLTSNFIFVKSFSSLLKFALLLIIVAQFCSCYWYFLGNDSNGWVYSKLYPDFTGSPFRELPCPSEATCINGWVSDISTLYITSIYWAIETMVTVGYGDLVSHRTSELLFSMLLEFLGVFVFAYLMGNINTLMEKLDDDTLEYLQEEEERLDEWLMKLHHSNPHRKLKPDYVSRLKKNFVSHWTKDHSSIIEEYPFFNQLPFSIKSELIDILFGKFVKEFHIFFSGLETQFIHEILVNLTPKRFSKKTEIIKKGDSSEFVYFLFRGTVCIGNKEGIVKYLELHPGSYFGDHLIFFNLKSSNSFVATSKSEVLCMCLERQKLKSLCNIYPNSFYVLKQKAILKRAYIRNSKILVEDEIKSGLSESMKKRRQSTIHQRKKEIENFAHISQSVSLGNEPLHFHFNLKPVEIDDFADDGSIAFEKRSESFNSIRESPNFHPGNFFAVKEKIPSLKKKLSELSATLKKQNSLKENKGSSKHKNPKNLTILNDALDNELRETRILNQMLSIKNQLDKLNKNFMGFSKELRTSYDGLKKDINFIKYDWEHRIFE